LRVAGRLYCPNRRTLRGFKLPLPATISERGSWWWHTIIPLAFFFLVPGLETGSTRWKAFGNKECRTPFVIRMPTDATLETLLTWFSASSHQDTRWPPFTIDLRKTRVGPLLSSSRTLVPCAQVCMHITSVQSEQEAAIVRPWQNVQHGVARLECWRLFAEQPTTRNCNRRPWTDRSAEDYTRLDWARLTTTMSGTGQPARNAHLNRYCPGRRGRAFSTSW
jgi:hypothetical protein